MVIRRRFQLKARGKVLDLGLKTAIMGIINVTPDSFSGDGCQQKSVQVIVRSALQMVKDGADILDIGGESTRPGAKSVSVAQEIRRVVPVVLALSRKTRALLSVDTSKPQVALAALEAGADMINIVRGTPVDVRILQSVKKFNAAVVLMHMRGTPQTMQRHTRYRSFFKEIIDSLEKSVDKCLQTGIKRTGILVDPGIGFAKSVEQNLLLVKELARFRVLGCPVLLGPSRKSFIGQTLNAPVDDRIFGTAAMVSAGIVNGAHIVRVHDVRSMAQVARMTDALITANIRNV